MLCPFLTSPGEGRPQHYITITVPEYNYSSTITNVWKKLSLLINYISFARKLFNILKGEKLNVLMVALSRVGPLKLELGLKMGSLIFRRGQ